jgi:hypothetical protein
MTTMTMTPGRRYGGDSRVERHGPDACSEDTNVRMFRARTALAIASAKPGGHTDRGRPPIVSVRLVVALQWAMFATCALRLAVGPL